MVALAIDFSQTNNNCFLFVPTNTRYSFITWETKTKKRQGEFVIVVSHNRENRKRIDLQHFIFSNKFLGIHLLQVKINKM